MWNYSRKQWRSYLYVATLIYLDDILIFGKNAKDLKLMTEIVKYTLKANNLAISEKKSNYEQEAFEEVSL